jgi:hypothetical protein
MQSYKFGDDYKWYFYELAINSTSTGKFSDIYEITPSLLRYHSMIETVTVPDTAE